MWYVFIYPWTAENIVKLPIDEKKYGNYKIYNGLMLPPLRIIKYMKESKEIYAKK